MSERASRRSGRGMTGRAIVYVVLTIGALVMIFPYFYELVTALKTYDETIAFPPKLFPAHPQWSNFVTVGFAPAPLFREIINSVIVTTLRVVGQVAFAAMAAYAIARLHFPFRRTLFGLFLSMLIIPGQLFLLPQYKIMQALGFVNTLQALFLPGIFSAFGVFLLRQFFLAIPSEIEEAARIDGANPWRIFTQIMLPLLRPAIAALALLTMVTSWSDLLWPLIVNSTPESLPVSVGLASLIGQYVTPYQLVMAGAVIASAPVILVFLVGQRNFVQGLAAGALK